VSLADLLRETEPSLSTIAAHLDGLSPDARLAETRTLDRGLQRRLYRAAEKAAPLTLDDFVPPGTPPRVQVIHDGRNTLPLPGGREMLVTNAADDTAIVADLTSGARCWRPPGDSPEVTRPFARSTAITADPRVTSRRSCASSTRM